MQEVKFAQCPECAKIFTIKGVYDPWHPVSEPPKPEDFEPTGKIQLLCTVDNRIINCFRTAWNLLVLLGHGWTHWRKITPL